MTSGMSSYGSASHQVYRTDWPMKPSIRYVKHHWQHMPKYSAFLYPQGSSSNGFDLVHGAVPDEVCPVLGHQICKSHGISVSLKGNLNKTAAAAAAGRDLHETVMADKEWYLWTMLYPKAAGGLPGCSSDNVNQAVRSTRTPESLRASVDLLL